MSKTHKTNRAYHAYKKVKSLFPVSLDDGDKWVEAHKAMNEANYAGRRYGQQRKMRAKMKVDARKAERKRNNRFDLDL